jgi:DNA-directed RNA polymerase specialized sigma24 family protein
MKLTSNKYIEAISVQQILELANTVVSGYVRRSIIPKRENEDVKMAIVEKFIIQREKIDKAFEGKSKLSTYYIAIMNRMCCEIVRRENRYWYAVTENEYTNERSESDSTTMNFETEKDLIIKQEEHRLEQVINSCHGKKGKLLLFLKFYFDLPISREEIEQYAEHLTEDLTLILKRDQTTAKSEVYNILANAVNLAEHKNIKGDAVRMWMNKHIDLIICELNKCEDTEYTIENIETLLELHYSRVLPASAINALSSILLILFL